MRPLWSKALRFRKVFRQMTMATAGLLLGRPPSRRATFHPRPNLITVPRFLVPFACASRLHHSPSPQVSATDHKRHASGEPSGFTGFPLRAGRTRGCLLGDQMQRLPKEGHQWLQIHYS